jgi:hypothetical protein
MPYLNLDDGFSEHRKVDALSHGAFRLHTSGLCYCARELTDGFVLKHRVARLMPDYKATYLAELIDAAMWLPAKGGYAIHDYLEWNKPRSWWVEKREKDAKRLADWRAKNAAQNGEGNA